MKPWRLVKTLVVAAFVSWHLLFLIVRNPMDLWGKEGKKWLDEQHWWPNVKPWFEPVSEATRKYGHYTGTEQGWSMFTILADYSVYLAARIEFTDGTEETVLSDNEPGDLTSYFRVGGWRQRKLEDHLVYAKEDEVRHDAERSLWAAYARWCVRRWSERNPDDERTVQRIVLFRRRFTLPKPGENPCHFEGPTVRIIAIFNPDGTQQ
jgi:hypothetical protein